MQALDQFAAFYAQMTQAQEVAYKSAEVCAQQVNNVSRILAVLRQDVEALEKENVELKERCADLEAQVEDLTRKNADLEAQAREVALDVPSVDIERQDEEK